MAHPKLDAFEVLPKEARIIVQSELDAVLARRSSQSDGYAALCEKLSKLGLPSNEIKLPSFSSFNRLVARKRAVWSGELTESRSLHPMSLSHDTRKLLSAFLRSLADDLTQGVPGGEA